MGNNDIRLWAVGLAALMILAATILRVGQIDDGGAVLTVLPALSVATLLARRQRRSCCGKN